MKARLSANVTGPNDVEVLKRAQAVASSFNLPVMIHMGQSFSPLPALIGRYDQGWRISTLDDQACQEALDAQEPDVYYYRNETFHEAIYAGSHNQFLIEQTRALYRRLRPYRRLQLRVRNRLANSYNEHDGVVKAILAGDGELAAQLLREHVMIQGQRFSDLMASLPQLRYLTALSRGQSSIAVLLRRMRSVSM